MHHVLLSVKNTTGGSCRGMFITAVIRSQRLLLYIYSYICIHSTKCVCDTTCMHDVSCWTWPLQKWNLSPDVHHCAQCFVAIAFTGTATYIYMYIYIYCIVPDVWCRSYISDISQQKNMAKTLRSIHSMHALFEWTQHYAVYHRGRSSLDVVPQHVCRHGGCCVLNPFRARSHGMGLWIIGKHQRW